jgi:YVTN family beta-propeller protein
VKQVKETARHRERLCLKGLFSYKFVGNPLCARAILSLPLLGQPQFPTPGANGTLTGSREIEPLRSVTNPGAPTTRQAITPAGIQTVMQARIHGVAFGASDSEIWMIRDGADRFYKGDIIAVDYKQNRITHRLPIGGTPGLQGTAWDRDGNRLLLTVAAKGEGSPVSLLQLRNDGLEPINKQLGSVLAGAPSASARRIVIPLTFDNLLAVVNSATGSLEGTVATGVAPFAAVASADGNVAWVSNWGGRIPKPGERVANLGTSRDHAVVDERGIAASGTVQRIDLNERRVTHSIETGLHPTALAWDQRRNRLYVANSNADSLTVINTARSRVAATVALNFFSVPSFGIAPTALALSADGSRLWVACAGINAVAQLRTEPMQLEGLIPTAYYPNSLAVSPEGAHLLIGTFFGVGEGSVEKPNQRHQFAARSTAHVVSVPIEENQLAAYTLAVAENTRLSLNGGIASRASRRNPAKPGSTLYLPLQRLRAVNPTFQRPIIAPSLCPVGGAWTGRGKRAAGSCPDESEVWRPRRDSNPRYRRESPETKG